MARPLRLEFAGALYHVTARGNEYRTMVGQESAPAWLETDWLLGQFDRERSRAQAGYAAFVRQGIGQPSVWDALRHQVFLGSEAFVERHCSLSEPLELLRVGERGQVLHSSIFRLGLGVCSDPSAR
jgi:hypothetical protein